MMTNVKGIQKTIEQSHAWIKILMHDYPFPNENKAFVLIRATLKALRDRLPMNEAVHLGSQLPVMLRGFYYEGWNPDNEITRIKSAHDFIQTVQVHLNGHEDIRLEEAVPVTMKLIFDMIDQGEAREVRQNLPPEIRNLF